MQLIWLNIAALAVAVLYYLWRTYNEVHKRKSMVMHRRVAYMLWVMATRMECAEESLAGEPTGLTPG